jgi:hypothetical protein
MAKKMASLLIALTILVVAFVLVPDPSQQAGAPPPNANITVNLNAEAAPSDQQMPGLPAEETVPAKYGGDPVIVACASVTERLERLGGADFRQEVGDELHSSMTPEEVVALCAEISVLEDDALLADVFKRTAIAP